MRSEICKGCCPSGGALFDIKQSRADYDAEMPRDPQRYVKCCRNCGFEKPWHKRRSPVRDARRAETMKTLASFVPGIWD